MAFISAKVIFIGAMVTAEGRQHQRGEGVPKLI
jgi:hypothetical protein